MEIRIPHPGRPAPTRTPLCRIALAAILAAAFAGPALAQCPVSSGLTDPAKPNKLYLYFPAVDDASYPAYAALVSPAKAFDVANLGSYSGTAVALRDAVRDVVRDDYCEFDVQVLSTTTPPPATFGRRATVAIGTDTNQNSFGVTFGQANAVDVGDPTVVDFAREWAGSYQFLAGGSGGALNGANGTLTRWAISIGGTAAHEAGHLFGLSHGNGATVKPGEDALTRHIMPQGSLLTDEQRAGYRRHFGDTEFSILAANVGLSIQTMHNWDLVNPNGVPAQQLQMEFLSPLPAVTQSWSYTGPASPWVNPVVSGPIGTAVFKSTTYNRFRITWSSGQSWQNGPPGVVPAGATFHAGATFTNVDFDAPDPIIITRITLLDGSGNPLTLAPRLPAYDAGTMDAVGGTLNLGFFNMQPGQPPLIVTNVVVRQLPRVLSINSMMPRARMLTWRDEPVVPWPDRGESALAALQHREMLVRDTATLVLARLSQGRHVFANLTGPPCLPAADRNYAPDVNDCARGIFIDLFPSTTVYVTATVIDPAARHWDPRGGRYVVGPVETRLYYQFAGRHPDLNHNGQDDFIDILTKRSRDANRDGVPDEAASARERR
jgi:hypothetical protein